MDSDLRTMTDSFHDRTMHLPDKNFFTRGDLAEIGVTDLEIRRARHRGAIIPLGRGAYVDAAAWAVMNREQRHVIVVRAVASRYQRPIVSHQSAATLHGLRMWNADLDRVHLSVESSQGGRITATTHIHTNRLPDTDLADVGGLRVTTVGRTAVDLARSLSFEAGVCVLDSALASQRTTLEELIRIVDASGGLDGCRSARRAIEFADGRSESVGESRSRVYVQRRGFPAPELQVTLHDPYSDFVARPDFLFEEGVLLEFDGRVKYGSEDDIFDEKRREDHLRHLGWVVVRWTWDDLASDAAATKLLRGFELAAAMPGRPLTVRR